METESRAFAMRAHGGQKYGDQPYVAHLDEVVGILKEYGYTDEPTLAAGYLHDTLEDTDTSAATLSQLFSEHVGTAVQAMTDEKGLTRRERKALTYARMANEINGFAMSDGFPVAIGTAMRVKLADRLANLRSSVRSNPGLLAMYRKEAVAFRDALYLPNHSDAMWLEYDSLIAGVTP